MKQKIGQFIRLFSYLRPHLFLIAVSFLLTIIYALANVYAMPLVRDLVNQLASKNLKYFSNHVMNAIALYLVFLTSKHLQVYVMSKISYDIFIQIRTEMYDRLQRLSIDFYSKWKSGDIVSRVFADAELVKTAIMVQFETILPCILALSGVLGYLFYLNWKLTILMLTVFPVFTYVVVYFSSRIKKVGGQVQRKIADITHFFHENISNMTVVQAFNMEEVEMLRFQRQHLRNKRSFLKEVQFRATQEPVVSFLQFLVVIAIIWYGGYMVVSEELSGADLLSYFTGLIILADQVLRLSAAFTIVHRSIASAERVFEIIDQPVSIELPKSPIEISHVKGKLEFANVSFAYEKNTPSLNNINLTVSPGETVAIVGASGAGKSTLINLIPRFYDPSEGSVCLDGVDIKLLDPRELRKTIGIVPQDIALFRGTLLENLRYGSPEASMDDIKEAVEKSNSTDFIDAMPEGLLTMVGDKGMTLSGGQKQRVSIARTFLKDPKILILDEATSALDSESEKLVQNALDILMQSRTSIVIAHRLSTIIRADRILVIEDGSIVESGTHDELMTKKGAYHHFYMLQSNQ